MSNNLLAGTKLFYPSAKEWMWGYCIYLGPFTDTSGRNYDLGIYLGEAEFDLAPSAAIVYGNEDGNYYSGSMDKQRSDDFEHYIETYRRAKELSLI